MSHTGPGNEVEENLNNPEPFLDSRIGVASLIWQAEVQRRTQDLFLFLKKYLSFQTRNTRAWVRNRSLRRVQIRRGVEVENLNIPA